MLLKSLRKLVHELHLELPRNQLVTWTSGNVSARDKSSGLIVIKPSGVRYDDLTPDKLVIVNIDGKVVEGDLLPSVDCDAHLYIYRQLPDVRGVVHTHSPYATAFAAVGRPIPVVLTAMADEFGGPIPCAPYAPVGGDAIGHSVVANLGRSPAVLLHHHGVFAVGPNVTASVKAAVMVEDAARTVFLAQQLGTLREIPLDEVARAHAAYKNHYGQRKDRHPGP